MKEFVIFTGIISLFLLGQGLLLIIMNDRKKYREKRAFSMVQLISTITQTELSVMNILGVLFTSVGGMLLLQIAMKAGTETATMALK